MTPNILFIQIMEGKVKQIKRSECYVGNQAYQHSHDLNDIRMTCLYAETYEGHQVLIDEADVLHHYGRRRFSENLVAELNSALHNKLVQYEKNKEGDYCLMGGIDKYLANADINS